MGSLRFENITFESNETLILGHANLNLGKQYNLQFRKYSPDETELFQKTFLYALSIQNSNAKNKERMMPQIMHLLELSLVQIPHYRSDIPMEIYLLLNKSFDHVSDSDYDINEEIRKLNYSQDYVRKLIIKETGMPPVRFMTNMRIEKAKEIINELSGNCTVKEIASTCGFEDELYFSRQFSKYTGMPPREYIKQARILPAR